VLVNWHHNGISSCRVKAMFDWVKKLLRNKTNKTNFFCLLFWNISFFQIITPNNFEMSVLRFKRHCHTG
jgi:hypothetical protein